MTIIVGVVPTVMELTTELVLALMTLIKLLPALETNTLLPSGDTSTPKGFGPTLMVAVTVLGPVLITVTVLPE